MLLPPTRFDPLPARSPAALPADPTPCVDFLPTTHFTSTIPLRGLSLRRFPSTRSQPLFSPPLSATIALLPPFRNALGPGVGVERERKGEVGRTREWLVGDSRHRFFYEEACIWHYCKRGASLRRFSSLFFFLSGLGGLAFVGYANSESPRRQFTAPRSTFALAPAYIDTRGYRYIECSETSTLPFGEFLTASLLRIKVFCLICCIIIIPS